MKAEAASDPTRKRRSSSEDPFPVRVRLLGGFGVWIGSRLIEEDRWRLRKAKSLIKLLALAPGHRLHREQVMDAFWPKLSVHKATNNLHQILHAARRVFEPSAPALTGGSADACPSSYLLLRDEQLTLCPDSPLWVDVEAFEEAAVTARHSQDPGAYRTAIDLYSGELLLEDRYEVWLEERRAHLRVLYHSLLLELSALSEAELVPQAVAQALGVREQPNRPLLETLADTLRTKKMLLVLDNCEHLLEAVVGLVDALLDCCPGLRILATGRETLNAAGEVAWVVPSLTVADARRPSTPQELEAYESVRLFVQRARQRYPSFVLCVRNGEAVSQVCQHLEGIPLAIELAAARMGALSAEQLSIRLEDPLKVLSTGSRTGDPRHRSLRTTLEWSFELLSEPERVLFGRLSVFAGGWTLEAAEEVCSVEGIDEGEVLDLLSRLVEKSLVATEAEYEQQEGAWRYRMLEPIRQYALERLEESGEVDAARNRHAASFVALAERAGPELRGPQQVVWLKRLDTERDNMRAAMRWLLGKGESETAARIGWAVWLFWWMHGYFTEGRRWMEEALAKGSAMTAAFRAKALFVAGTMADGQADRRSAEPLLEESVGLFKELGDKLGSALALGGIGLVAVGQRQHERGIAYFQEAVDLFLEIGQRWSASVMLSFLAVAWFRQGDLIRAKRLAEQGLELAREIDDPAEATSIACCVGATVAQAEGDHERAKGLFGEGLKLSAASGEESNVAYCLQGLAASAASEGRQVCAARLWGAAEALLEKIEAAAYIYTLDRSVHRDQVSAARVQLDGEAWQAAWTEGRAMPREQAIEYALSEDEEEHESPILVAAPDQQPPPADQQTETLTCREQEVALLVGGGLTNRQIAQELSISDRTVENHITKILKKQGYSSRARIATWVAQR